MEYKYSEKINEAFKVLETNGYGSVAEHFKFAMEMGELFRLQKKALQYIIEKHGTGEMCNYCLYDVTREENCCDDCAQGLHGYHWQLNEDLFPEIFQEYYEFLEKDKILKSLPPDSEKKILGTVQA